MPNFISLAELFRTVFSKIYGIAGFCHAHLRYFTRNTIVQMTALTLLSKLDWWKLLKRVPTVCYWCTTLNYWILEKLFRMYPDHLGASICRLGLDRNLANRAIQSTRSAHMILNWHKNHIALEIYIENYNKCVNLDWLKIGYLGNSGFQQKRPHQTSPVGCQSL